MGNQLSKRLLTTGAASLAFNIAAAVPSIYFQSEKFYDTVGSLTYMLLVLGTFKAYVPRVLLLL